LRDRAAGSGELRRRGALAAIREPLRERGRIDQSAVVLRARLPAVRARGGAFFASMRVALPSIACSRDLRCWRRTAYSSRPAPTAPATATAGLRRTNFVATRLPALSAPSAAPVSIHLMARSGTRSRRVSPTLPASSSARPEIDSSLLMGRPDDGGNWPPVLPPRR